MANEADLKLIQIPEFPKTTTLEGTGPEYVVLTKSDGITYGMLTEDFKAFLGVDALMQMGGAITPASTLPAEGDYFWPATEPGVYANAGGVVVPENSLALISRVDGVYSIATSEIQPQDITGLATKEELKTNYPEDSVVGIETVPVDSDMVNGILNPINVLDTNVWRTGYVNSLGNHINDASWFSTKNFIPLPKGTYVSNLYFTGNAKFVIYKPDKTVHEVISDKGSAGGSGSFTFTIPGEGYSVKISATPNGSTNIQTRYLRNTTIVKYPTSDVFLQTSEFPAQTNELIKDEIAKFGLDYIQPGHNFIAELTGSNLEDRSKWDTGHWLADGVLSRDSNWRASLRFIPIPKGEYLTSLFFTGNAKALIYDLDFNITQVITNPSSGDPFLNKPISVAEDSYIRISHRQLTSPDRINQIFFNNTVPVPAPLGFKTASSIDRESDDAVNSAAVLDFNRNIFKLMHPPMQKRSVVSFISDDGHIRNDEWFIPALGQYKATFAIPSGWMNDPIGKPDYWRPARVKEVYEDGHDIASHTYSHPHLFELTESQRLYELRRSKEELLLVVPEVPMFISPFGERNATIDRLVRQFYEANFITGYGVENPLPLRRLFVNRVSFDANANSLLIIDTLKAAVDTAVANGEWLVFAIHPHYSEYTNNNPVGAQRRDELTELIAYIESKDIQIMTAKKAYENFFKNPVQINDEIDATYYALGTDGSEAGNIF